MKKLVLNKETVRKLDERALDRACGGNDDTVDLCLTIADTCQPVTNRCPTKTARC